MPAESLVAYERISEGDVDPHYRNYLVARRSSLSASTVTPIEQ